MYLVEHRLMQTRHALKVLHAELSTRPEIVQRFINEARAAGALRHPNVVPVRDVGQVPETGAWYLVMDYLEGETLASYLARSAGPVPPSTVVHILGEVLAGLQAAHDRKFIHRDVKPDNIYLTVVDEDPLRALLLDFGIAQLGEDARLTTRTGSVIGTPQYMAPEQHRAEAIDHRADLWAVGAIAYQMLTGGWLPYHDRSITDGYLTTAEIYHRMMTTEPVDPRLRNPRIPAALAEVLVRAVATDRERRPRSARELAMQLANATPADGAHASGIEILKRRARSLWAVDDLTETLRTTSATPSAGAATPISRYEIGPQLGKGGMAEVFLAHTLGAEGFTRPIALKRILPEYSNEQAFSAMFIEEARLASALSHPNVVQVLDFNRDDTGRLYLVMEFVAGKDLATLVDTGTVPAPVAIFIAIEMLRGLGYAHQRPTTTGRRGVVHRDVSPHNVMLSWEGSVKIGDFGIARARDASGNVRSQSVKGKPAYLAPEQINGITDGRSDLFAVGIVLWELLVGRRLFAGSTNEVLAQILFRSDLSPRAVREDIAPDVEAVVMKLLAKQPSERYQTAEEAIAELARCVDHPRDGRTALATLLAQRYPGDAAAHGAGHVSVPLEVVAPRFELPTRTSTPLAPRGAHAALNSTLGTAASESQHREAPSRGRSRFGLLVVAVAALSVLVTALGLLRGGEVRGPAGVASQAGDVAQNASPPASAVTASAEASATPTAPVPLDAATIGMLPPPDARTEQAELAPSGPDASSLAIAPDAPPQRPAQEPRVVHVKPPADPPSRGERAARGKLSVYATPWALVHVDGRKLGETPVHVELPVGVYRVRLANDKQRAAFTITVSTAKDAVVDHTWK